MLKKVIMLNGEIENIGDWDYGYINIVTNKDEIEEALIYNEKHPESKVDVPDEIIETVATKPMPEGAIETEMDLYYFNDEYGWVEANFSPPISLDERLKQTEAVLNAILLGGI